MQSTVFHNYSVPFNKKLEVHCLFGDCAAYVNLTEKFKTIQYQQVKSAKAFILN